MYDVRSVGVFACELGGDFRPDLSFISKFDEFVSFLRDSIFAGEMADKTSRKEDNTNSGDKHCERMHICELNFCMWQILQGRS